METIGVTDSLSSEEYWEGPGIDIRLNPRLSYDVDGLAEAVRDRMGIESAVVLATSGSQGRPKFAVLEKKALLASARSVNDYCELGVADTWLGGLSTFHVGGLGIYARAFLSGAGVVPMAWDEWTPDGSRFVEMCLANWVRVTSLTPVHLHDLVTNRVQCPESIRGVFIGGGQLSPSLGMRARGLGWPLWTTYGMTEAGSQIATSCEEETEWLPVLPHWKVRGVKEEVSSSESGVRRLAIKGAALFSGYLQRDEGEGTGWSIDRPFDEEGWFISGDLCRIKGDVLRFAGRADDMVKIMGELVSVSGLERDLGFHLEPVGGLGVVIALPHPRKGNELVAFVEGGDEAEREAKEFSQSLSPLERFARVVAVSALPRTESGKVDRGALRVR